VPSPGAGLHHHRTIHVLAQQVGTCAIDFGLETMTNFDRDPHTLIWRFAILDDQARIQVKEVPNLEVMSTIYGNRPVQALFTQTSTDLL